MGNHPIRNIQASTAFATLRTIVRKLATVINYMYMYFLLVWQEVHTFEWAMSAHAHSCTSLYLDTDATQLALNPMVSL